MTTAAGGALFEHYLHAWRLVADGAALQTHSSDLLPVRTRDGAAAMLKLPRGEDERRGSRLMPWWQPATAPVLAHAADGALLMARATQAQSLAQWSGSGRDDDATRVLCATAARLHAPRMPPPEPLPSLREWFRPLAPAAAAHGGLLARAQQCVSRLLDDPYQAVPLHGDLHHDNVLDFGPGLGWRAIDPHAVHGERGFDYANLFCNPQAPGTARGDISLAAGVFERRFTLVQAKSGLPPGRLLQWILAYCGLSAAWTLEDGDDAGLALAVAARAAALLDA